LKHGEGKEKYKDGSNLRISWKDDKPDGTGLKVYIDGK
jgi:hypothetical protein